MLKYILFIVVIIFLSIISAAHGQDTNGTLPDSIYLPVISMAHTPTATFAPTNTPTATFTPTPIPTATPLTFDIDPASVALRAADMPAGYTIDRDEAFGDPDDAIGYVSGWRSWFRGNYNGIGSIVREYTTEPKATEAHVRIQNYSFSDDFYDTCAWGVRNAPVIANNLTTYSAIHCTKGGYDRIIYLAVYKNIVTEVEYANPRKDISINENCEANMVQRFNFGVITKTCLSSLLDARASSSNAIQISHTWHAK